ncbi:calbindin-32-like [Paramacrobiotus metropolitanus]|uniref:calbindin-32-like n=1 Tax=Paramacrobiotus metropolitanus TaxID=2943436 RepID=UPI002445DE9A|nr:calbindin-32-like [Paramacrobiotus metropolitanus]
MPVRRIEDPNRKGGRARSYIDNKLRTKNGELVPLSADAFQQIYLHYDRDGNGYLERDEIDKFLKDYLNSSLIGLGEQTRVTDEEAQELRGMFMEEFDENKDGRISLRELTSILPVEESFFVMFRHDNKWEKGTDYMKIWKKYDRDMSGYIEIDELKTFLRDVVQRANPNQPVKEDRLDEYTRMIMEAYDTNKDGKLGMSELAKLLPPEENFVQRVLDKAISLHKVSSSDVEQILNKYDKDNSGTLEGNELSNLVREILSVTQSYYNASDVYEMEQALLKGCDVNNDGRIDRRELALIIQAIANSQTSDDHSHEQKTDLARRVYQGRKSQYILSYVPLDADYSHKHGHTHQVRH